jgi:AraC-like DNA-binding protein
MRTCNTQFFVLEHYLRIATGNPKSWLSALQVLTGSPRLSQEVEVSTGCADFDSRLSFLKAENVNVCGIYLRSASSIVGSNAGIATIIMPVQGSVDFEVEGRHFCCTPGAPFVLKPNAEFRARLSSEVHLFIVQISETLWINANDSLKNGDAQLAKILNSYLLETPFFRDHHHAMQRIRCFEEVLARYLAGERSAASTVQNKVLIGEDRRICTALKQINDRLATDIELETIARDAGLSLRNFYYLMKKYSGMTPYNYCLSRRLVKVRESLICRYREEPGVGNHALKWGFNHAGRFSSYYYDHFGEYPSDTIQCLEVLKRNSAQVVSVDTGGASGQKTLWYTSAVSPS